jgi:hypothetical protein
MAGIVASRLIDPLRPLAKYRIRLHIDICFQRRYQIKLRLSLSIQLLEISEEQTLY